MPDLLPDSNMLDSLFTSDQLQALWTSPEAIKMIRDSKGQFMAIVCSDFKADGNFNIMSMTPIGIRANLMPFLLREMIARLIMMTDQMNKEHPVIEAQKVLYSEMLSMITNFMNASQIAKKDLN